MTERFVYGFDWDIRKAMANWHKHGVSFEVAATVFRDPLAFSRCDVEHSQSEERWITLGKVETGQLVRRKHGYGSSQLSMPRHMNGDSTKVVDDFDASQGNEHAKRVRLLQG